MVPSVTFTMGCVWLQVNTSRPQSGLNVKTGSHHAQKALVQGKGVQHGTLSLGLTPDGGGTRGPSGCEAAHQVESRPLLPLDKGTHQVESRPLLPLDKGTWGLGGSLLGNHGGSDPEPQALVGGRGLGGLQTEGSPQAHTLRSHMMVNNSQKHWLNFQCFKDRCLFCVNSGAGVGSLHVRKQWPRCLTELLLEKKSGSSCRGAVVSESD